MTRRIVSTVFALVLVVTACGDDDTLTTATTAPPDGDTTTAATTPGATTMPDEDGDDGEDGETDFYGNPAGTGTVEIGDVRYDFDLSDLCLTMFGALGVVGSAGDGSDVTVNADFPPEDWESSADDWDPPYVSVSDDERGLSWEADENSAMGYDPGMSQVDSFTITDNGHRVFGEATFIEFGSSLGDDPMIEEGRFEFHCPEG